MRVLVETVYAEIGVLVAEDVVQDVFIKFAELWKGPLEPDARMTAWLRTTAHNLAVDAIRAELARGGQVYYLHNRVKTIDDCAKRLAELLPEARFAVAHGQLHEKTLEEMGDKVSEVEKAIDAFFSLSDELRVKIPETMKYFCTTEAVAMYLQKHIVFRKRKIFYGNGTPQSVIDLIGAKHKDEKFLITTSDTSKPEAITRLFKEKGFDYTTVVLIKPVSNDLKELDLHSYDMVVFYNPSDVKSLYENFPEFAQGDIRFISYGRSIVSAMEEAGLQIAVKAPSPEHRSVAEAIESYLKDNR